MPKNKEFRAMFAELVEAFVKDGDVGSVIESNPQILEDAFLAWLKRLLGGLEANDDQEQLKALARETLDLVIESRAIGVTAALANRQQTADLKEHVLDYFAALRDLDAQRAIVERYPDLLTPAADAILARMSEGTSEYGQQQYQRLRAILRDCREHGCDVAFRRAAQAKNGEQSVGTLTAKFVFAKTIEEAQSILTTHPQIHSMADRELGRLIEGLSDDEDSRQLVADLRAKRELLQSHSEKSRAPRRGQRTPQSLSDPPRPVEDPPAADDLREIKKAFLKFAQMLEEDVDADHLRGFIQAHPVITSITGRRFLEGLQEKAQSEEEKETWVVLRKLLDLLQGQPAPQSRGPVHLAQPGSGVAINSEEHSYAERIGVRCHHCGNSVTIDVWMILDVREHPELVETIAHDTLRHATCQHCGQVNLVDAPLIVYRASTSPRVLVTPSMLSRPADDQQAGLRLIEILAQRLGETWGDDLASDTAVCKPGELEAVLRGTQAPMSATLTAEETREGAAWWSFLGAGTWNEMHEILEAWPGFYDERKRRELRLLAEYAGRVGDENSRRALDQRLALLDQCSAIGPDAALLNAMGEAQSKPERSGMEDRSVRGVMTMDLAAAEPNSEQGSEEEPRVPRPMDATKGIPQDAPPQQRAQSLKEIANAYLRRYPAEPDLLEPALWYFRAALKLAPERDRAARLTLLVNVAGCYIELRRLGRPVSTERVLPYFEEAARYIDRERDALRWATMQETVATLVGERSLLTQADVDQSIASHERALEVFTQESHPHEWASIQNNLSVLHGRSSVGDRSENVEIAITHSRQAVAGFHALASPQQEALARINLANSYLEREQLLAGTGLDDAIHHYGVVLESLDSRAYPVEFASAHTNLALALLERDQRKGGVERSIILSHLERALKVLDKQSLPTEWADVHLQLGMTFSRDPVDVELAAQHYQNALEVYGETTAPRDWANVQHDLGVLYTQETEAGRVEYAERAALHLRLALRVCTADRFPAEHRQTQGVLGSLFFSQGEWQAAHDAFAQAASVGERLIESAYTDIGRRTQVAETTLTAARDAYALAKLRCYPQSMMALENGKTRLLNEALAVSGREMAPLPDEEQEALASARNTVRRLESEEGFGVGSAAGRSPRAIASELRRSRDELTELMAKLRREHPHVFPTSCDEKGLLSLVPDRGALVALLFTGRGGAVFVIPHGAQSITSDHFHWLDDVNLQALRNLLKKWMESYSGRQDDPVAWRATILKTGKWLWEHMMGKVAELLESLELEHGAPVVLFPQGGLGVLPLHAAWSPGTSGHAYFMDRYTLTYGPSGYALRASQAHLNDARRSGKSVLAVINPTRDLDFASVEGEILKSLFNLRVQTLDHMSATRAAVIQAAAGCAYLHFACHGQYDWYTPARSAMVLAGDERLTLANVLSELDLTSVRLVTLSACETGLSDIRRSPDEYLGLPAAFLQAGAPGVVSTLWPVDDVSSALLMFDFYYRLVRQHETPGQALAGAQRWLSRATNEELSGFYERHKNTSEAQPAIPADIARRQFRLHTMATDQHARPYCHPYHWAAFTFTGN
jgi:CHAT domain-containing protein/tetratricopeptide (TPR) repeat protein